MKYGLIIGKFMPPHKGHTALINFGLKMCDHLTVLVCALHHEPIPGYLRHRWLKDYYKNTPNIFIDYTNKELPQGRLTTEEITEVWAAYLKVHYPKTNIIFSSEPYGAYIAKFMNNIKCKNFDNNRYQIPISGSAIRENPFKNWDYLIPSARSFFTKKIALIGPDNNNNSSIVKLLAEKFQTDYVIENSFINLDDNRLEFNDMPQIIEKHSKLIETKQKTANKIFFTNSNLLTFKIYSQFHFQKKLKISRKIKKLNTFDITFYCDIHPSKDIKQHLKIKKTALLNHLKNEKPIYKIIKGSHEEQLETIIETLTQKWPWLKNQTLQ